MIPGILLGALHIQLSPYNSKEVGYYYSQLVSEEKRRSEDHSISGRPAMSLSFFQFVFIIELITIWQTYIYAYIYLFPYTQIICRPKKVENHYISEMVIFIQQSCIYDTTQLRI